MRYAHDMRNMEIGIICAVRIACAVRAANSAAGRSGRGAHINTGGRKSTMTIMCRKVGIQLKSLLFNITLLILCKVLALTFSLHEWIS